MEPNRVLEEIWIDDQIGRVDEAALIISYVEGASRQALRTSTRGAITLAVDGDYGVGKTFFLRRLSDQLALSHPVAFVDAWADDLADEPLTALVATLKCAIEPLVDDPASPVASKLKKVMEVSGRVAKIASLGLFKRLAGLVITTGAVEGISEVFEGVGEDVADTLKEGVNDLGKDTVAGIEKIAGVKPLALMEQRVADFEAGQAAMAELKAGLRGLVEALDATSLEAPIVIIIDELDRCRPTYAIKLLEEIKHLFDVPGLVFIFGMHGEALATSVRAAYGADFNGGAYLKRFVQRRYSLSEKPRSVLIEEMLHDSGVDEKIFQFYEVSSEDTPPQALQLHALLDAYATAYALSARDIQELIDVLVTSAALARGQPLYLPLLLPLAIGQIKRLPSGSLPDLIKAFPWQYVIRKGRYDGDEYKPAILAKDMQTAAGMSWSQLANLENASAIQRIALHSMGTSRPSPLTALHNYPKLLTMVAALKVGDAAAY